MGSSYIRTIGTLRYQMNYWSCQYGRRTDFSLYVFGRVIVLDPLFIDLLSFYSYALAVYQ